jgi:hypothetical protein
VRPASNVGARAGRRRTGKAQTNKQRGGERGSRIGVQGLFAGEEWNGRYVAGRHGGDDRGEDRDESAARCGGERDEDQLVGRLEASVDAGDPERGKQRADGADPEVF